MPDPLRTLVVDVIPKEMSREEADRNLEELHRLITTLGGIVVVDVIQKRGRPSAKTFVGEGKAEVVEKMREEHKADLVIFNQPVKATQRMHLSKVVKGTVWDRIDLILNIFEQRAHSAEAKLQIKLAQLKYELPKLYGRGKEFSQLAGGIGVGRGKGEKFLEIRKRAIHRKIEQVKKKLANVEKVRSSQRSIRKRKGLSCAALVGYTNSGKSTLLRNLTNKENVYADDVLFATLDTQIGDLWLPKSNKKCLIADTIGFIRDLPPDLLASFKATLEEVQEADLLLHTVDCSDPKFEQYIAVTNEVLADLACEEKPQLLIFNKIDRVGEKALDELKSKYPEAVFIAGGKGVGIEELVERIEKSLE